MTKTTVLLYWLLVICGLTGITFVRLDDIESTIPLWAGTLVGIAVGQGVAWMRIRTWLIAIGAVGLVWVVGATAWLLPLMSDRAEDFLMALVPAAICGWFSLSERGGLAAFWYPSVLWMLVILDDPKSRTVDFHASAPIVVGLGLLFVAFLRARETRRVAIWQSQGGARIAKNVRKSTLSASPMRSVSELAWTGLVGIGALVVAAWIAPLLWQKQEAMKLRERELAMATPTWAVDPDAPVCCPDRGSDATASRITEYLPLLNQEKEEARLRRIEQVCTTACRNGVPLKYTHDDPVASNGYGYGYGKGWGSSGVGGAVPGGFTYGTGWTESGSGTIVGGNGGLDVRDPLVATNDPRTPPVVATPVTPVPLPNIPSPTEVARTPLAPATPVAPPKPKITSKPPPARVAVATPRERVASPVAAETPTTTVHLAGADRPAWEWMLTACGIFVLLQIAFRGVRRALTLRHLTRPFWRESVDQRISNHWHRMLIGLRDAGIHPAREEQPNAFARRVGIEGMSTCATILERVRHGVRLVDTDLEEMASASTNVIRTAKRKAGVAGRLAAQLRWPLA